MLDYSQTSVVVIGDTGNASMNCRFLSSAISLLKAKDLACTHASKPGASLAVILVCMLTASSALSVTK